MPVNDVPPRATLLERFMCTKLVRRAFQLAFVQRVLSPARGDRSLHRFIRYSMVSGVAIVISQVTIFICAGAFHLSGIAANTIGAVMATPASYELNRKWAWGKRGKSHLWKEVAPFWGLTVIGFLASTGTVQIADNYCASHHVTGVTRALSIMGASLFAYGIVWVGKFILFNKVIFASALPAIPAPPADATAVGNGHRPAPSERALVPTDAGHAGVELGLEVSQPAGALEAPRNR